MCSSNCGAPSSLDHFLICRKRGLIVQRHNEIRDAISDLAALMWGQVKQDLLCPKMVMMEPLLPIFVFVVYGHHSLRHCLTSVPQTLSPVLSWPYT